MDPSAPSQCIKALRQPCLGLQILRAMTSQNNISEKGVSEIWGFCLSSSLHKELAGQSCTGHLHLFGSLPYLQSN